MKLLRDLVQVKVDEPKEVSKGGILVQETLKEYPPTGTIMAVADSVATVKVGDRVIFSRFAAIDTDEPLLKLCKEDHLLAVINES